MKNRFVTFGEIMLRMTRPDKKRLTQGSDWNGCFGGSEANVAVSLAMFGDDVEYVTRLPNNKIGKACMNEMRRYNVGTDYIIIGGDRLGLYFFEESTALRSSSIVYDREDSSLTTMHAGMAKWAEAFADAHVFHWSGISAALSQGAADTTEEAVNEAVGRGVTVSCDINIRTNLWKYGKSAHDVLLPMAKQSDIVFGTSGEWKLLTGITPPDFTPTSQDYEMDREGYEEFFKKATAVLPKARKMIVALRNSLSANHHLLSGVLYADGKVYTTRVYDVDNVVDPMGVGDAYIAAYLHAFGKNGSDDQRCLDFALAASVLKCTISGDFNLSTEEEVEGLMNETEE